MQYNLIVNNFKFSQKTTHLQQDYGRSTLSKEEIYFLKHFRDARGRSEKAFLVHFRIAGPLGDAGTTHVRLSPPQIGKKRGQNG